jgi:hypothetical protein
MTTVDWKKPIEWTTAKSKRVFPARLLVTDLLPHPGQGTENYRYLIAYKGQNGAECLERINPRGFNLNGQIKNKKTKFTVWTVTTLNDEKKPTAHVFQNHPNVAVGGEIKHFGTVIDIKDITYLA